MLGTHEQLVRPLMILIITNDESEEAAGVDEDALHAPRLEA